MHWLCGGGIFVYFLIFLKQHIAASADTLSEKLLDDLFEDTAGELWSTEQRGRLQAKALPLAGACSLESMLQRMEEIEVRFSLLAGLISANFLFTAHTL